MAGGNLRVGAGNSAVVVDMCAGSAARENSPVLAIHPEAVAMDFPRRDRMTIREQNHVSGEKSHVPIAWRQIWKF